MGLGNRLISVLNKVFSIIYMKNLYVGSLPYSTTQDELNELFAQAGAVERVVIIMEDGRSKGFGFVEMTNEDEAMKAIEMFNGYDMGGRTLIVNEARPRVEGARPTGPRTGGPRRDDDRRGGSSFQGGRSRY